MRGAGEAWKVVFVCYGTIRRRGFASGYCARRRAGGARPVETRSAGFFKRTGRPADPRVVEAARHRGVDLTGHRSTPLDRELIAWADVILVMDRVNLRAMRTLYPAAMEKTYLLGSLDGRGVEEVEISDPFEGAYDVTERACGRIARAVDRLVSVQENQRWPSAGGAEAPSII
jgi:protein-tyrosine-phosphatase